MIALAVTLQSVVHRGRRRPRSNVCTRIILLRRSMVIRRQVEKMKMLTWLCAALLLTIGSAAAADTPATNKTIVETAVATGKFNMFVAAVKAAGLVGTLNGDGPLTVFVPTDEAFVALPKGTIESLLKPENKDRLVAILKYHVVAGSYPAAKMPQNDSLKTLPGSNLTVTQNSDGVMIDKAKIINSEIECSNGLIHVIDAVVLPKE